MKSRTDEEIIESVKKGNTSDYSILVDRYKNKAFTMLKRMLGNEFDAEEVLMDCYMKAYRNLNNFKFESKFSTWFYKITYNTALTKLSGTKRKIENEMISVEDIKNLVVQSPSDDFINKDISETIKKIIGELPLKNSAVLTMFYIEEMNINEIAEVMGISVSNVKVILHRSRIILRDIITERDLIKEII